MRQCHDCGIVPAKLGGCINREPCNYPHELQYTIFDYIPDTVHKPVTGMDVTKKKGKNKSQNAQVCEYFYRHPGQRFTAWEINERMGWPERRITSTRWALTDLKDAGYLVKLEETRKGIDGEPNHLWTTKK